MSTVPDGSWPPVGGTGAPAAPANPAADRNWRLRHSWWLIMPVLGCSCLGGFAFIYVGLRAKRPQWWIAGIVYAALGWTALAFADGTGEETALGDLSASIAFASWVAGMAHAFLINPAWLRWQAAHRPWYAQPAPAGYPAGQLAPPPGASVQGAWAVAPQPGYPTTSAMPSPQAQPTYPAAGLGQVGPTPPAAEYWAGGPAAAPMPTHPGSPPVSPAAPVSPPPAAVSPAAPPAGWTLDVNTAGAEQLAALPGFDTARVRRVLAERQARGGFGSLAEFAAAAGLAPHEYARLRDVLVCAPPADPAQPGQPHGRVLDF